MRPSQLELLGIARTGKAGRGVVRAWMEATRADRLAVHVKRLGELGVEGDVLAGIANELVKAEYDKLRAELARLVKAELARLVNAESQELEAELKMLEGEDDDSKPSQPSGGGTGSGEEQPPPQPEPVKPSQAELRALAAVGDDEAERVSAWLDGQLKERVSHFKQTLQKWPLEGLDIDKVSEELAKQELQDQKQKVLPRSGKEPLPQAAPLRDQTAAQLALAQSDWSAASKCADWLLATREERMAAARGELKKALRPSGATRVPKEIEEPIKKRAEEQVDGELKGELIKCFERHLSEDELSALRKDLEKEGYEVASVEEIVGAWMVAKREGEKVEGNAKDEFRKLMREDVRAVQGDGRAVAEEDKDSPKKTLQRDLDSLERPDWQAIDKCGELLVMTGADSDGKIEFSVRGDVRESYGLPKTSFKVPPHPRQQQKLALLGRILKEVGSAPMKVLGPLFAVFAPLMLLGLGNPLRQAGKAIGAGQEFDLWYMVFPFLPCVLMVAAAVGAILLTVRAWRTRGLIPGLAGTGAAIAYAGMLFTGLVGIDSRPDPLEPSLNSYSESVSTRDLDWLDGRLYLWGQAIGIEKQAELQAHVEWGSEGPAPVLMGILNDAAVDPEFGKALRRFEWEIEQHDFEKPARPLRLMAWHDLVVGLPEPLSRIGAGIVKRERYRSYEQLARAAIGEVEDKATHGPRYGQLLILIALLLSVHPARTSNAVSAGGSLRQRMGALVLHALMVAALTLNVVSSHLHWLCWQEDVQHAVTASAMQLQPSLELPKAPHGDGGSLKSLLWMPRRVDLEKVPAASFGASPEPWFRDPHTEFWVSMGMLATCVWVVVAALTRERGSHRVALESVLARTRALLHIEDEKVAARRSDLEELRKRCRDLHLRETVPAGVR